MRLFWQFKKLTDWDLRYRLEHHNRKYLNRDNSIYVLMDIEKKKELEFSRHKCVYCINYHKNCICKNRRHVT